MVILDTLREIRGRSCHYVHTQLKVRQALCALRLRNVAMAVCPALSLRSLGLTLIISTVTSMKAALSHGPFYFELKLHSPFQVYLSISQKKVFWHCMMKTEGVNEMQSHSISPCSWVDVKRWDHQEGRIFIKSWVCVCVCVAAKEIQSVKHFLSISSVLVPGRIYASRAPITSWNGFLIWSYPVSKDAELYH